MRLGFPATALVILIFLSGCIETLPADQRLACIDLTSKSYAFVPECDSEQKCFELLQKSMFSFDCKALSPKVQASLHRYKSNASLSWLYFNKARKNITKVHEICQKNTSISGLVFELNELTHNMAKAFEHSDLANRESFAAILLEHSDLESQDIMLAREEPLFNDFSVVRQNSNELSSRQLCLESKSYACLYLAKANEFKALVSQTGFEDKILSESNIFEIARPFSPEISKYLESSLSVPLIGQALPQILSFLSGFTTAQKSMGALQRAPAFELMLNYNSFMGLENSCLSRFSSLFSQLSLHRKQLIERNNALEAEAEAGIEKAEQGINALLSESYTSFDQNFFQSLYSGLNQEKGISAQKYGIRDFSELRDNAEAELQLLKDGLSRLKEQQVLGNLSLGGRASALKQLNSDIKLLWENLEYLRNEVVQGLVTLCKERAAGIEEELEKPLPNDCAQIVSDLKARARFSLSRFKQSKTEEELLLDCRAMVEDHKFFSLALQDFEKYLLIEKESLGECLLYLESILGNKAIEEPGLSLLRLRLNELKAIEKPYPDLGQVQRLCISLKEDLGAFLQRHEGLGSFSLLFSEASSLFAELSGAKARGLYLSEPKIGNLRSQLDYFAEFFSGQSPAAAKALPLLPDLESGLSDLVSVLREELDSAIISFAEQNPSIETKFPESYLAGTASPETVRLELDNPFSRAIETGLTLSVPFQGNAGSLLYSSPNVLSFRGTGKSVEIELSSLPRGKTILEFSTETTVEKQETLKVISASSEEAILSKEIAIDCKKPIALLEIKTKLVDSNRLLPQNILVTAGENPVQFTLASNTVSFFVENCSGKQRATVLFSVKNPVEISMALVQEGSNATVYSLSLKNLLPEKLADPEIILPIEGIQEISEAEIFELSGKKLKASLLPTGRLSFALDEMQPMQETTLLMRLPPQEATALLGSVQEPEAEKAPAEIRAVSEKISLLSSRAESAEQLLEKLQAVFSSASEEELISAKYVPPISRAELEKLGLELNKLRAFLSKREVQDFTALSEKGLFGEAAKKLASFENELGEKLLSSETILGRLSKALDAISADALVSYNSAAEQFNKSQQGSEAKETLERAQELLLKGDLLSSIALSRKATSMLALPGQNRLDLPVFVLPVVACAALVTAVRLRKKKKAKVEKELLRTIRKNW